jgi:hypothetical protein
MARRLRSISIRARVSSTGQPLADSAELAKTLGVASLDFDKDGWMDLLVTQAGAPGLAFGATRRARDLSGLHCR